MQERVLRFDSIQGSRHGQARRTLKRVTMEDGVLAAKLVAELMEDENAEARRTFLAEHARKIKELDV